MYRVIFLCYRPSNQKCICMYTIVMFMLKCLLSWNWDYLSHCQHMWLKLWWAARSINTMEGKRAGETWPWHLTVMKTCYKHAWYRTGKIEEKSAVHSLSSALSMCNTSRSDRSSSKPCRSASSLSSPSLPPSASQMCIAQCLADGSVHLHSHLLSWGTLFSTQSYQRRSHSLQASTPMPLQST